MASSKAAKLPSSLVEMRQKKKLFFATRQFFDFVKLLESTYVKNLTLKMMMAYADGDLVKTINDALLASELIRNKFDGLFGNEDGEAGERYKVLEYLLELYVHMQGCWFVKYMKGRRNKTRGETKAEAAPTRTKVAYAHVQSKAIAKAVEQAGGNVPIAKTDGSDDADETSLWAGAAEAVVEYENSDDEEDVVVESKNCEYIASSADEY